MFKRGDKVICMYAEGYPNLTVWKEYTILCYQPKEEIYMFVLPAYVKLRGDNRKGVYCHASRFKLKGA